MATPSLMPARSRTNWLLTAFELGIVLAVAGLLCLHLNPFWRVNDNGLLDARSYWWNSACEVLLEIGLIMFLLALVGSIAALVSRCFAARPLWPYLLAGAAAVTIASWLTLKGFTRDLDFRFEWNSADGFNVFQLQGQAPRPAPWFGAAEPVWTSLIALQIQPQLQGYFRVIDWQRVNGHIRLSVTRMLPVSWPITLGTESESLEDPDETPLMQAADKGDLQAVRKCLIAKVDVNAHDQSGETALIHACRNPRATPALIAALLAAGADPNAHSRNNYSPLAWATLRNNTAIVQLLRRAGAKP